MPEIIKKQVVVEKVITSVEEKEFILLSKEEAKLLGALYGSSAVSAKNWPKADKLLRTIARFSGRKINEGYHLRRRSLGTMLLNLVEAYDEAVED